ncbi:hypothetical protein V5F77_24115 [Xanthobacter sp. DSM 24535]|uniref:hypothetical protein n=1 Tax=Roseixanthobacter psychrophilus TaxID=3119917 RepID=UPI00372A5D35
MSKIRHIMYTLGGAAFLQILTNVNDVSLKPFFTAAAERAGLKPEAWVEPVFAWGGIILNSPWFQYGAAMFVGAVFWEIVRRGFERWKPAGPPAAAESNAPTWQETYRRRETLKAYEAACLAADELPAHPVPKGPARSLLADIVSGIEGGKIPRCLIRRPEPRQQWLGPSRSPEHIDLVTSSTEAPRAAIAQYLRDRGHVQAANNLGSV